MKGLIAHPQLMECIAEKIYEEFIQKFQCCAECGMRWAEPMREKWVAGWRPDDNEIKSHREKIKQIPPFFYF